MRFLRMFTNSLLAGGLGAAYLTVLVLQLNPHVPLMSGTTFRWLVTLGIFYGLHLAAAFYVLLVIREVFSMEGMSPGWASVRVLAWLSAVGAALAATLMWFNVNGLRAALGDVAARRMMAGALATIASAVVLLGIAIVHYSTGRRGNRVGGTLFALAALGSVALPLTARGPAVTVAGSATLAVPRPADYDARPRVTLLLLDGASLEYVRTHAAGGRLPNFSKLLDGGASMYLASVRPTQPVPVWAAVATGMYPAKNNVRSSSLYFARGDTRPIYLLPDHCFSHVMVRYGAIRTEPNSPDAWGARPLWNILDAAGIPTGVVRFPLTYPARPTLGFVLTDRLHDLLSSMTDDAAAFPPEALADLRQSFFVSTVDRSESLNGEQPEALAARRDRQYAQAAHHLTKKWDVQVLMIRFEALDVAGHLHYEDGQPTDFRGVDQAERRRHAQQLERAYAEIDREIGDRVNALGKGDLLLVVAGFGMQRQHPAKEMLASLLRDSTVRGTHERGPDGFLVAYGTDIQAGRLPRGSIVDVTPTVLYFLGLPVGRDMDGFVRTDLFTTEFTAERPIAFIATHSR